MNLKKSSSWRFYEEKKTFQFDFKLWMRDVVLSAAEWKRDFERYCQTYIFGEEIQFSQIYIIFCFLCVHIWNKFQSSYIKGAE